MEFKDIEFIDEKTLKAGSGVFLSKISNIVCKKGLTGLEFACGIPGTLGGAIKMNAGAHGNEMKDIIRTTTYVDRDGNVHTITNKENEFGYRTSAFTKNKDYIILSAEIQLEVGDKDNIERQMKEYRKVRKEKQPINYPSAGSSFKRGENYITAKLIDECGLKGVHINDAYVSEKHAGFIVNKGNATAKDVLELIEIIKQKVYEKFNIEIETEIEILG